MERSVTITKGTGGRYPLLIPRRIQPRGIATLHPLAVCTVAAEISRVASGVNVPSNGDTRNHETKNGSAIMKISTAEFDTECDDAPIPANNVNDMASIADNTGRFNGDDGIIVVVVVLLFSLFILLFDDAIHIFVKLLADTLPSLLLLLLLLLLSVVLLPGICVVQHR